MVNKQSSEAYEENAFPLAYLLTFRTYGTWLHRDIRGSYQRSRDRRFGTINVDPSVPLDEKMSEKMEQPAVALNTDQRAIVSESIAEVCEHRTFSLRALNVRTNHVHAVVSASVKPEKIVNDLKAIQQVRCGKNGTSHRTRRFGRAEQVHDICGNLLTSTGRSIMFCIARKTFRLISNSSIWCCVLISPLLTRGLVHKRVCAFGRA